MGARYQYDINKTTRYIDVHKQFQGGLKTVDTDESLKDVYLREAENISLSEFNFIEKRYGLHKLLEHAPWASLTSVSSIVQGYFEYYVDANTVHKIIVIEGKFYVDQGAGFQVVAGLSVEEGQSFDLSSIGIYIKSTLTSPTNFSSTNLFYYENVLEDGKLLENAPRFWQNNPNGVAQGFPGERIHATDNVVYRNNGTTTPNSSWVAEKTTTFPFPSGLTQGNYYLDTRTNRYYIWNNVHAYNGQLTIVKDIYDAEIQDSRPIEGVRIDDKLYIATGTYPMYYKGDGKIYVLPQYEMSDLDIQQLGYDLNTIDLETALTNEDIAEDSSHGPSYDGKATNAIAPLIIKRSQSNPRIPYVGSTVSFEFAIHFYNNSAGTFWNTGFDTTSGVTTTSGGTYGTVSSFPFTVSPDKANFTIKPKVYRKPSGAVYSLYQQVPDDELEYITLTNDLNTTVLSRSDVDPLPLTTGANLNNLKVTVNSVEAGYWDYRVDWVVERTGFFPQFSVTINPTVQTTLYQRDSVEFTNIWVTPEELVDYKYEPYDTLKVHTCNRIIEHNGRIGLFGSTVNTDYIFFSTAGAKEYFPYRYSLQFTNDLSEGINAVNRFMNILVVQSPSYTWGIKGDSPFPLTALEGDIYRKISINPTIGCIAPYSVKNVRNQLYFLSKEGIFTLRALYAEDLRYNVDPIDRNIYNIVPRDTNAVSAYFDDQYWLHFPTTGETLRYYVDKKAWVKDTYAAWNDFNGVFKYINESGKLRFITQLSQLEAGDPVKIFDIEVDYSLPTDLTKDITSKFTTSYLNQNYPFHPKNYKEAKFDFAIQNEYNTSMTNLPVANYAETINYVQFTVDLIDRHFYSITFEPTEIGARPAAYTVEIDAVPIPTELGGTGNITQTADNLSTIRFMSNKTGNVTVKITVTGKIITGTMSVDSIKLYDSTYDHTVTFNTLIFSEEGTLNVDPIDSYTTADVAVPIDLGTRTGNWTFGTSNFGNVIVAIKTVKLSGRGYNIKTSVIEDSKSKWTLESIGITYKMKKARST